MATITLHRVRCRTGFKENEWYHGPFTVRRWGDKTTPFQVYRNGQLLASRTSLKAVRAYIATADTLDEERPKLNEIVYVQVWDETLSDGSKVHNLRIGNTNIPCLNEKSATKAADSIVYALRLAVPSPSAIHRV
jgi:hypothetical protein